MRYLSAILAAIAVFVIVICAVAVATPWFLESFYKCAPHDGSCGDTAGWGTVILAPVLVAMTLLLAGVSSVVTYLRVLGINFSK